MTETTAGVEGPDRSAKAPLGVGLFDVLMDEVAPEPLVRALMMEARGADEEAVHPAAVDVRRAHQGRTRTASQVRHPCSHASATAPPASAPSSASSTVSPSTVATSRAPVTRSANACGSP